MGHLVTAPPARTPLSSPLASGGATPFEVTSQGMTSTGGVAHQAPDSQAPVAARRLSGGDRSPSRVAEPVAPPDRRLAGDGATPARAWRRLPGIEHAGDADASGVNVDNRHATTPRAG